MNQRRTCLLACASALVLLTLAGCASQSKNPSSEVSASATRLQGSNTDIQVVVLNVRPAADGWLEYEMQITNRTGSGISNLVGIVIAEGGKNYDAATYSTDLNKPPAIAKDLLITSGIAIGGMALAFAGIPFLGPLALGGYMLMQTSNMDDQLAGDVRFAKFSFAGKSLPGREELKGSFFFPAVKPVGLKIGYVKGEARQWLAINSQGMTTAADTSAEPQATNAPQAPKPAETPATLGKLSVLDAQKLLNAKRYDAGPADGAMGPRTVRALRSFQTDRKIKVTGKLDKETRGELLK